MTFRLASNLTLPANALTDTYAVLGTRGSGKSYFAGKMVEVFHDGGGQVVVVDPAGIWYGLRLAADGHGRGLDIPVFGGWHGDIPLEATAGELVARLVGERRLSVVLDVSEFTGGQQHRFVRDFARALFDLKKRNRSPVHVVLEEAHEFLPQQVGPGEAEMVGVVKRLWKIGRNFGIGGTLVTQRAAEINKGALNLTEVMVCGKLKGPQDRKAIEGWARDQGADDGALGQLPTLPNGTLLVWRGDGAIKVRVDHKRTFDASKTPEAGDAMVAQALPKIDLEAVRAEMAATIEEARTSDPKALRDEIARLRAELNAARALSTPTPRPRSIVTVPPPPARVVRAATASQPEGWTMEEEALYQKIVDRLKREAPALLKVLATKPELEVTVERRTIECSGDSIRGRIARLIHEGWLDEAKPNATVARELERRGFKTAPPNVWKELEALAAMGFLTKEGSAGYQAVAGMKVNVTK